MGIARSWHSITVYGFVLTGIFFVIGLLTSTHWERLVPTSPGVFVQAWNTFVLYANFHLLPEPDGSMATTPYSNSHILRLSF